jgi:hypothetical protein
MPSIVRTFEYVPSIDDENRADDFDSQVAERIAIWAEELSLGNRLAPVELSPLSMSVWDASLPPGHPRWMVSLVLNVDLT